VTGGSATFLPPQGNHWGVPASQDPRDVCTPGIIRESPVFAGIGRQVTQRHGEREGALRWDVDRGPLDPQPVTATIGCWLLFPSLLGIGVPGWDPWVRPRRKRNVYATGANDRGKLGSAGTFYVSARSGSQGYSVREFEKVVARSFESAGTAAARSKHASPTLPSFAFPNYPRSWRVPLRSNL
jgi:hypothetical protein